jgi:hypothetical protein
MVRVLDHHAETIGDASGALELHLALRYALLRQDFAQHERKARSHRVHGERVALQGLNRDNVLLSGDRQEAVVGGENSNQIDVGAWREIGLVLSLTVGDDVVDGGAPGYCLASGRFGFGGSSASGDIVT